MASIQCSACQSTYDSSEKCCPSCGAKPPKKRIWLLLAIAAAVVIIGAILCLFLLGGDGWDTEDGHKCYFKDGEKVVGFQNIDGKTYYFSSKGYMETGFQRIDSDKYYFDENGVMLTGLQTIDGDTYLFDKGGIMEIGWATHEGAKLYLEKSGIMATGWQDIEEKTYYFNQSGAMQTGWLELDGKTYYLDNDGILQRGVTDIDGKLYYLNADGFVETGWVSNEADRYFVNEDGTVYTGWKTENNEKYFFSTSEDGKMAIGKWEIAGKGYYFDEDGKMCTGEVKTDDDILYLNENGEFTHRLTTLTVFNEKPADDVVSFSILNGVITTYYHDIGKEIHDASFISVSIATSSDTTYRGDWQVYVHKTNGYWKFIGTAKMKSSVGTFEFELDEPLSFDAYTCIPAALQSNKISSSIRLEEIDCTDYNFGPKNGKD